MGNLMKQAFDKGLSGPGGLQSGFWGGIFFIFWVFWGFALKIFFLPPQSRRGGSAGWTVLQ